MKKKNNNRIDRSRKFLDFYWKFIEILALYIPRLEKYIVSLRKQSIQKECIMAEISPDDKILLIGCGPHPTTSLIVAEETQAKVVAIDKNIKAVNLASSYIQNKDLTDTIKIEQGDGIFYPVENFDVIFIAVNVWPIDLVLNHIFNKINYNTRVIFRDFKDDITDIITNGYLSKICFIKSSFVHKGLNGQEISDHKSLLLKKK